MKLFNAPTVASVEHLLAENNLPYDDLNSLDLSCFLGCGPTDAPAGVVGLEIFQQHALLRSLVVASDSRQSGCGQALVSGIEQLARSKGVNQLYLLTETAERFFADRGYDIIERQHLPEAITQTTQFRELCPQSATAMTKQLI